MQAQGTGGRSNQQKQSRYCWRIVMGLSLATLVGINLTACNFSGVTSGDRGSSPNSGQPSQSKRKKVVLTTFTVIADMVRNVAGDAAEVQSLTKIGAEIHGYEPTPSDLVRAQKADLILDNGMGLERWAQRFYAGLGDIPHVTISEGITPIDITEDAYAGKPNPHAWMSPKLALVYVENIRKALSNLDPENATTYSANAKKYSKEIQAIDLQLRAEIDKIPRDRRFIVTCEGAFSYLAKDYGLNEIYLWPVNSERQATPRQVQKVIDVVRQYKIPVVFCESTVSADIQKQVAVEAGTRFGGVFYVDSLSQADGSVPTYLTLMRYNVGTLVKGLQGQL
jgi:manganese transport system substrate-binding protein